MTAYLIDSSVLVDVLTNDRIWADWSLGQLEAAIRTGRAIVNPIVYAEISTLYQSIEALDAAIAGFELALHELPKSALFLAGRAFREYRRRGGPRPSILPDFFIGAHAAVGGLTLVTRDIRRRRYFPTVATITP